VARGHLGAKFGAQLVQRRLRAGWTQPETAQRCHISARQYLYLEKAHSLPGFDTLCCLAMGFGVEISELVPTLAIIKKVVAGR